MRLNRGIDISPTPDGNVVPIRLNNAFCVSRCFLSIRDETTSRSDL